MSVNSWQLLSEALELQESLPVRDVRDAWNAFKRLVTGPGGLIRLFKRDERDRLYLPGEAVHPTLAGVKIQFAPMDGSAEQSGPEFGNVSPSKDTVDDETWIVLGFHVDSEAGGAWSRLKSQSDGKRLNTTDAQYVKTIVPLISADDTFLRHSFMHELGHLHQWQKVPSQELLKLAQRFSHLEPRSPGDVEASARAMHSIQDVIDVPSDQLRSRFRDARGLVAKLKDDGRFRDLERIFGRKRALKFIAFVWDQLTI